MMKNRPGPSSARNLPSRSTTTRCHWSATRIAAATIVAIAMVATTIQPAAE
jgi:hypothetical protein